MSPLWLSLIVLLLYISTTHAWDCDANNRVIAGLTPVGKGGFGKLYLDGNGNAIKAITDDNGCDEARAEYGYQAKVHAAFSTMASNTVLEKLVKSYVVVAKNVEFCENDAKFTLNGVQYKCYMVMSKLNGVKVGQWNIILAADETEKAKITTLGNTFEIMGQLGVDAGASGFYNSGNDPVITVTNPTRGYFFSEDDFAANGRVRKVGWTETLAKTREIMGFIEGTVYYGAKMVPVDIEMAIGIYGNKPKINVLDFGKFTTVVNPKDADTLDASLDALDFSDIYCDWDDVNCKTGWAAAGGYSAKDTEDLLAQKMKALVVTKRKQNIRLLRSKSFSGFGAHKAYDDMLADYYDDVEAELEREEGALRLLKAERSMAETQKRREETARARQKAARATQKAARARQIAKANMYKKYKNYYY
eukprot:103392_1